MSNSLPIAVGLACLVMAGCATHDVNPSAPRAGTGYVDFYTASNQHLSWQVKRATGESGHMKTVFLDYWPLRGNILRLAAPEGTQRFEVWFCNQVTTGPQTVEVPVVNGSVIPVQVTLTASGASEVRSTSSEYRPTARGTRQVTRTDTDQQESFKIGLAPGKPEAYQPKERMPYFAK